MKTANLIKIFFLTLAMASTAFSATPQTCSLNMSVTTTGSSCKATGSIIATVTNGSGSYNYTVTGGSYTTNTSSNIIDGLQAGVYTVKVKDISSGCTVEQTGVTVGGNYQDPRFTLNAKDVSCFNATDGSITLASLQYGKSPFTFTLVAPSASGTGTFNNTGNFSNLVPGDYYVQLSDSCGGLQTRVITIGNFIWNFSIGALTKPSCDSFQVTLSVSDGKGNTNNGSPLFSGFMYGITVTPGDTTWSAVKTFRAFKGNKRSGTVIVKDACGNRKYLNIVDIAIPKANAAVTISNQLCAGFTAAITGQQNLTNPQYCLYSSSNALIACNATGTFTGIPYGAYYIAVKDVCYDTVFNRAFTVTQAVPSAGNTVAISNRTCSGFTATAPAVTNMTNPQYCVKDSNNAVVACNSTGVFNNLPYGPYCMTITDGCTGTVITRCFTERKGKPVVAAVINSNLSCATFTASASGQGNVSNPQYCLYDASNNLIGCNTTGVFNNLAYGSYCMQMKNDPLCYDTTIVTCFTVLQPVPSAAAAVTISNKNCNGFTATITGQQNLNTPQYCLFSNTNTQLACNNTGVFNNIPYGTYCIKITNNSACYDTIITRCFTAGATVPSVAAAVTISAKACATFTATVGSTANLTNPQYCILDNNNTQIACNNTGVFTNLPYGTYCMRIKNDAGCYDTTFSRCFTQNPPTFSLNATTTAACNIGNTNLRVVITNGFAPFTVKVYRPNGVQEAVYLGNSTTININDIPALAPGNQYKIVVQTACAKDSVNISPASYTMSKGINASSKCPGGVWLNGSGDLVVNAQFSGGAITPSISMKNGTAVSIPYTSVSGSAYTFANMEPATYIVKYLISSCASYVYDTFTLKPYDYPNLDKSAVYQCNNNNFSVSAAVKGGVSPYTYEIIGSLPASPSILQAPQAAATFTIGNGVNYSLVRLRAIDACGNATINDASILPLANTIITASSDCYYNNISLSVDTVANATYSWYRKTSASDSVLVSSNQTHTINYLLPKDTGMYVNVMTVNSGCLTKVSSFRVTGMCGGLLSVNGLTFAGSLEKDNVQLKWNTARAFNASRFVIEKSADGNNFREIGSVAVSAGNNTGSSQYFFSDISPLPGKNYYRLRITGSNGKIYFSETVVVTKKGTIAVSVMPNPVAEAFTIRFQPAASAIYHISLVSAEGKVVLSSNYAVRQGDARTIQRPGTVSSGVYYLVAVNQSTNEKDVIKLFFK